MAIVAARELRSPAFRRRSDVRRHRTRLAVASRGLSTLILGFILSGALGLAVTTPASAQSFTYNPLPPRPKPPPVFITSNVTFSGVTPAIFAEIAI